MPELLDMTPGGTTFKFLDPKLFPDLAEAPAANLPAPWSSWFARGASAFASEAPVAGEAATVATGTALVPAGVAVTATTLGTAAATAAAVAVPVAVAGVAGYLIAKSADPMKALDQMPSADQVVKRMASDPAFKSQVEELQKHGVDLRVLSGRRDQLFKDGVLSLTGAGMESGGAALNPFVKQGIEDLTKVVNNLPPEAREAFLGTAKLPANAAAPATPAPAAPTPAPAATAPVVPTPVAPVSAPGATAPGLAPATPAARPVTTMSPPAPVVVAPVPPPPPPSSPKPQAAIPPVPIAAIPSNGRSHAHITFATNQYTLTPEDQAALDAAAPDIKKELEKNPNAKLHIDGYADTQGQTKHEAHNVDLSKERAQAVMDYLHNKHDIPQNRMEIKGHGSTDHTPDKTAAEVDDQNNRAALLNVRDEKGIRPLYSDDASPSQPANASPSQPSSAPSSEAGGGNPASSAAAAVSSVADQFKKTAPVAATKPSTLSSALHM